MDEPDYYILQSLGISAHILKTGYFDEIIKEITLKISQLSPDGNCAYFIDVSKKLLPYIQDGRFSSTWVVLLDKLSTLSHQEDVKAVYTQINEKQGDVLTNGSLPVEILHKLWLSQLSCLEFAVLTLIDYVCCKSCLPVRAAIQDAFIKSCMIDVASREVVIYKTIYRMLISLTRSSGFTTAMSDITSEYCHLVRNKTPEFTSRSWRRNTLTKKAAQLELMLQMNTDPEGVPSLSRLNTLQLMHKMWMNNGNNEQGLPCESSCPTSKNLTDWEFEDIWCLSVEYRSWVFAALKNVLLCDQQYIGPCLWYIATHQRINPCSQVFKTVEPLLQTYIRELRCFLHTSYMYSELASQVIPLAEDTYLNVENKVAQMMKEEHDHAVACVRSLVGLILVAFFFQSDGGVTVGYDIFVWVTGSQDVAEHTRCLIYHYHTLKVIPRQWSSFKQECFLSYISDLSTKLESEDHLKEFAELMNIHNELKLLLPD